MLRRHGVSNVEEDGGGESTHMSPTDKCSGEFMFESRDLICRGCVVSKLYVSRQRRRISVIITHYVQEF